MQHDTKQKPTTHPTIRTHLQTRTHYQTKTSIITIPKHAHATHPTHVSITHTTAPRRSKYSRNATRLLARHTARAMEIHDAHNTKKQDTTTPHHAHNARRMQTHANGTRTTHGPRRTLCTNRRRDNHQRPDAKRREERHPRGQTAERQTRGCGPEQR